jgi:hypothetical protein
MTREAIYLQSPGTLEVSYSKSTQLFSPLARPTTTYILVPYRKSFSMRRTILFLNISFVINCYSFNFQQSKISEAMSSRNGSGGRNGGRFNVGNSSKASRGYLSAPVKVAGEKGAESHTVSEDCRIRLTEMLLALRESSDEECRLEFTSELSNTERKFLVSSVKISNIFVSYCGKLQYSTPPFTSIVLSPIFLILAARIIE